jgi:glyoxylase-like metal-dependent hydrolase (beta-lactamase superfamily II)
MYGNCPKPLWQKWAPPDERKRIDLACRALLIKESSGRHVLFESGIGVFFEPKMRDRFGVIETEHVLLQSLAKRSVRPEQIDVVVLSHLHFDHAGGLLTPWKQDAEPDLVFPNAHYVVSEKAWQRATAPHKRDRASFLPALNQLLEQSGRLELVSSDSCATLGAGYHFRFSDGHTPGLMLTRIAGAARGPITFLGDLVPGIPWLHLPITMGYDRYPELLIEEKKALLEQIAQHHEWVFYTHDANYAASRVRIDDKGRYGAFEQQPELGD